MDEVLHQISRKIVLQVPRKDLQHTKGALQVCAGQDAGTETAIHAMFDLYQQNEVEVVLLINAENTFNSIKTKAMLHNISISTFISNCYLLPARLFAIGNKKNKIQRETQLKNPRGVGVGGCWEFIKKCWPSWLAD